MAPSGPVPLPGTPRYHQWLAKTLARRAAAYLATEDQSSALADLQSALLHDPSNEKLKEDISSLGVSVDATAEGGGDGDNYNDDKVGNGDA